MRKKQLKWFYHLFPLIHLLVFVLVDACPSTVRNTCAIIATRPSAHWWILHVSIARVSLFSVVLFCIQLTWLPVFNYRDLSSQLKWRFIHGETDDDDIRAHIEEKRGVRKSKFDELAGWHAPLSLPPEAMHLFFGGGTSSCLLASRK